MEGGSEPGKPNIVFKVLIIGETMVGKTSILMRYVENNFADDTQATIGVDYRPSYTQMKGYSVKLMLWDTAGQEKFRSITKSFYHGAHGALVVYDVTKRKTFEAASRWVEDTKSVSGDIPIMLVGNKCDLPLAEVDEDEAEILAKELGTCHFRISALSGENVRQPFAALCEMMTSQLKLVEIPSTRLGTEKSNSDGSCFC